MTEETEPLTLHGLRVENFKRVSLVDLELSGAGIIQIRGKNKAGKSSLIDGLWAALSGNRVSPDEPIHKGKRKGSVSVDLGELKITRTWSQSGSRLEVHRADGTAVDSPQTLLNSLVSQFVDPCTFLHMKPEDQAEQVLAMSGLGAKLGQVEIQEEAAAEARRDTGRDLKREQGALASAQEGFAGIPEGALTVEAAAEQLAAENERQSAYMAARSELSAVTGFKERKGTELEQLMEELKELRQRIEDVTTLHSDAIDKEVELTKALDEKAPGDVVGATDAYDLAKQSAAAFSQQELIDKEKAAVKVMEAAHTKAVEALDDIRQGRGVILENAEFPVEGMAYDAEVKQLILQGVPFPQASSAEKLKAAIEIAIAGSPGVRVLFVREASLLDEQSLEALQELAEARGYQVILEVVDDNPEGPGVYIEDGRIGGQ